MTRAFEGVSDVGSEPRPRLLGIHVAYGYSPEAAVFAHMLAHRDSWYDASVLFHATADTDHDVERFAARSRCATIRFDSGWRRNQAAQRRLTVDRLRVIGGYLARTPMSVLRARRLDPSVIYSSQQHYDCRLASTVALTIRRPQIIHLHYNIGPTLKRHVLQRLRRCDHVVTVSDYIREQAIRHGVSEHRVTTVHNSIEAFSPTPPGTSGRVRADVGVPLDSYVVGMISRLDPGKGHLDAIAAFTAFARQRPDVWLVIAGRGTAEPDIRRRVTESSVGDRIVLTGFRSDVPELLSSFDSFLHPSRHEPFGMAILEALASGLPTVAYREGGVPEIVTDDCGILVDPCDVDGLADALRSLYDDAGMAAAMGRTARLRVERSFRPVDAGRAFGVLVQQTA
jgi:glycosyltransferase involved in cell wall biosynthesis